MDKIRIAVIGVGDRGLEHLDCLLSKFKNEVTISGILCSTPESTQEKAMDLRLHPFASFEEISKDNTDAVIIATKSNKHTLFGRMMLQKGLPVLIEKPFTTTLTEAKDLTLLAKQKNTFAMVGHAEHFNPAYQELCRQAVFPFRDLKTYRLTKETPQKHDASVVLDLMINELGMMPVIAPKKKPKIRTKVMRRNHWQDELFVGLLFNTGCEADLLACRRAKKEKQLMMLKDRRCDYWQVDFSNNTLIKNDVVVFQDQENSALKNELSNFINSVRGIEKPQTDAEYALKAMRMAFKIEDYSRKEELRMNKNHKFLVTSL